MPPAGREEETPPRCDRGMGAEHQSEGLQVPGREGGRGSSSGQGDGTGVPVWNWGGEVDPSGGGGEDPDFEGERGSQDASSQGLRRRKIPERTKQRSRSPGEVGPRRRRNGRFPRRKANLRGDTQKIRG